MTTRNRKQTSKQAPTDTRTYTLGPNKLTVLYDKRTGQILRFDRVVKSTAGFRVGYAAARLDTIAMRASAQHQPGQVAGAEVSEALARGEQVITDYLGGRIGASNAAVLLERLAMRIEGVRMIATQ